MGRLLLDGRNPQSWDTAVKLFSAMEFGKMADGCRKGIMETVEEQVAFAHANTLVHHTCEELVNGLVVVHEGSEDGL
jgi:IMP cyclohydrolase